MPLIKFTIITLFPEALQPYLDSSMLFKAQERGIIAIDYVNLRDFGLGSHKSVDDTPYGGGDGMLLRPEPVFAAVESVKAKSPQAQVFLPTPVGETWNQALARKFAGITDEDAAQTSLEALEASITQKGCTTAVMPKNALEGEFGASYGKMAKNLSENRDNSGVLAQKAEKAMVDRVLTENEPNPVIAEETRHYIIICPHYEGYDERIMTLVDYPISLGNYVLTGGELAALIMIDSMTRLLPGVLGGATSAQIESFSDGDNLEFPQYTKPAEFRGMKVPEVLLSGHHGKVAEWRQAHTRRQNS